MIIRLASSGPKILIQLGSDDDDSSASHGKNVSAKPISSKDISKETVIN